MQADETWSWLVGVIVTFVGTTINALGYICQKRAHLEIQADEYYWNNWTWRFGFCVVGFGNFLGWLVQGLTSQSILSCSTCWNILVIFAVAPLLFGEVVSNRALIGAAVVFTGCMWIIATGPKDFRQQSWDDLESSWKHPGFMVLLMVTWCVLVFMALLRHIRYSNNIPSPALSSSEFVIVASVFSCYCVTISKTTSALLDTTVETGNNEFFTWRCSLLYVVLASCGLCCTHFLNMGLKYGEIVFALPLYNSLGMLFQMLLSATFFDEFRDFDVQAKVSFSCGVIVVLIGTAILARHGNPILLTDVNEAKPLTVPKRSAERTHVTCIPVTCLAVCRT